MFKRQLLRKIPFRNLIRIAKWLEKDPDNSTWFKKPVERMDDEEVLEAVFWACYY